MASQQDLDQGGISRQWVRQYLGPSVGWVEAPAIGNSILPITIAGTYNIDPSISLVAVNCAGSVTIILPSAVVPSVGPQAIPRRFVQNPITIVDVGGQAQGSPITIQALAGQTVMGFASIQIAAAFGGFTLQPNSALATWTATL